MDHNKLYKKALRRFKVLSHVNKRAEKLGADYPEVRKKVLKGYKRGETPVTGRAADYLEPELDQVRESIGDLAKDDYDLLICALYPTTGEQYLKWKYGVEERPASIKPKTLEDIRKEDEAMAAAIEQVCQSVQ